MATVMVSIDGKTLRFACEEGDEPRLLALAQKLDSYISRLKEAHGEIGDYRLSIMAGIMVLDEMGEVSRQLRQAEDSNADLIAAHKAALRAAEEKENALTHRVDNLAQRIIIAAGKIAPKAENDKG